MMKTRREFFKITALAALAVGPALLRAKAIPSTDGAYMFSEGQELSATEFPELAGILKPKLGDFYHNVDTQELYISKSDFPELARIIPQCGGKTFRLPDTRVKYKAERVAGGWAAQSRAVAVDGLTGGRLEHQPNLVPIRYLIKVRGSNNEIPIGSIIATLG